MKISNPLDGIMKRPALEEGDLGIAKGRNRGCVAMFVSEKEAEGRKVGVSRVEV